MKKCSILATVVTAVILVAVPALADYRIGMGAYRVKDYKWAMKEFKADQKNPNSLYNLGIMYYKGEGVKADHNQGIEWIRKAAEKGHVQAQFLLGTFYDSGKDLAQDRATAAQWYRKAAKKGHTQAQFNLGLMYVNGEGVEKDHGNAVVWLKKAARGGHQDAGRLLKTMGEDVPAQALPKKGKAAEGANAPAAGTPSALPPGHPPMQ
ncbi:tetratricopeptide repeat protein [Geomonas agri]|uniref:tetratricopeptide repeat protein n=1 Tax=Geomonas agri TaxID=2873702 RepID=UPI001CD2ECA4|nr:tetratricopeptide repeat protein [Geomonas agri]